MRALACAVLLIGCGRTSNDYPLGPPGSGPGRGIQGSGSDMIDSGVVGGDGGPFVGQVCLTSDPRVLTTGCSTTGAAGITVSLGANTTTTDAAGHFSITVPPGNNSNWIASGPQIFTSVMPFGAQNIIPAIDPVTYNDMRSASSVSIDDPTEGSIIAALFDNGSPAQMATATTQPASLNAVMYDTTDKLTWDTVETSTHGVVWVAGLNVGTVQFDAANSGETKNLSVSVPIISNSITFVSASF